MKSIHTIFISLAVCAILAHSSAQSAYAAEKHAGQSALLKSHNEVGEDDAYIQSLAIKAVLTRHKSPMQAEADHFVDVAIRLELDPYLLPAIAGVESGYGRALITGSNNPFGWNVGRTRFQTWSDGILTVGEALRYRYIDRGADSLDAIGHIYAGGSKTWAPKVFSAIRSFEREEARIRRYIVL